MVVTASSRPGLPQLLSHAEGESNCWLIGMLQAIHVTQVDTVGVAVMNMQ